MVDDKNHPFDASDLSSDFQDHAGEEYRISEGKVAETAKLEAQNKEAYTEALEQHDMRWIQERNKLGNTSDHSPDFDLGTSSQKNLHAEYEERLTQWQRQADQIDTDFTEKKEAIRDNGQTLTDEFTDNRGTESQTDNNQDTSQSTPEDKPQNTSSATEQSFAQKEDQNTNSIASDSRDDFSVKQDSATDRSLSDDFTVQAEGHDQGHDSGHSL